MTIQERLLLCKALKKYSMLVDILYFSKFFFFLIYLSILFVVNFVIHWNETAMGLHVFKQFDTIFSNIICAVL